MTVYEVREMLGWCTVINIALMIFSFVLICALRSFVYKMHTKWFPMSEQVFNAIVYSYLGLYKICIIVFNIIPWIALSIMGQS
ncbi:MAG: DUF6868 family protein [Planctomycetota bacterium]|jgi:hypothetical protein